MVYVMAKDRVEYTNYIYLLLFNYNISSWGL